MKRGSRTPVGNITGRLPGRRRGRVPGLGRITKNLPGARTAGTAGGVLLGAGAAAAASRVLVGRRDGHQGSSEPSGEREDEARDRRDDEARDRRDTEETSGHNGHGLFGRLKDTATGALPGGGGEQNGRRGGRGGGKKVKVTNIVERIDIGAPRRLVYDQWTQFQDYPSFMKKVVSVDQADETKLNWKAKVFWSSRTWESTIVEQAPDEHIVWRSKGPKGHVDGTVSFHKLSQNLTRVLLVLEYHPQGLFERTANLWRAQGRRVRLELKHFHRYVMTQSLTRPDEVEGWRGEIRGSEVVTTHEDALDDEREYDDAR